MNFQQHSYLARFTSFIFAVFGMGTAGATILIDGFTVPTNDRFDNDPSFIMNSFDLSGVAISDNGIGNHRWVTMVSENVFLSADHFAPPVGTAVRFYATNDPAGPFVTRTVTSNYQQVDNTDVIMGVLDAPLPIGYTSYSIATEDINNATFGASSYAGANAYMFGRSPSAYAPSLDMAVGRNRLDIWADGFAGFPPYVGDVIGAIDNDPGPPADPNYVTYEAMLGGTASGAPLFVEEGGELTLVGINWFIGDTGGADPQDLSAMTYLGNYDEEILAFINANAVPEPSSALMVMLSLSGFCLHRARSRMF